MEIDISTLANWSSLIGVILSLIGIILSIIGIFITLRVSKKVDNVIEKQMEEFGKRLYNAKLSNKGYNAGVIIQFDENISNNELYENMNTEINHILENVQEKKYDENGKRIINYGGYNNSLSLKGNIMLLEIQYLNEKLKNGGMDESLSKRINEIKDSLIEYQKRAIPWE